MVKTYQIILLQKYSKLAWVCVLLEDVRYMKLCVVKGAVWGSSDPKRFAGE